MIRAAFPGREPVWLASCGSTMTEAARLARAGCAAGSVVVAEEQTAGQGRLGRVWHSEPEAGLYVTIVLRPALAEENARVLSMALGLATAEAIQKIARVTLQMKSEAAPKADVMRSTVEFDLVLDIPKTAEDPARKQKEREQLEKNIANSKRQLSDEVFLSKAPAKVVDSIRAKLADYQAQLAKMK